MRAEDLEDAALAYAVPLRMGEGVGLEAERELHSRLADFVKRSAPKRA
jgi:hypothetical protein